MAPPLKRVVPWMNREEWIEVYEGIFSASADKQQDAIDKIAIWKHRCLNELSMAIELTGVLVSLKLKDAENERMQFLDDHQMRCLYGMVVTRFINEALEMSQDKKVMVPLQRLAKETGVPRWIVDLRHEATHKQLPLLQPLRMAVDVALAYLKKHYWEEQAKYSFIKTPGDINERKLLFEEELTSLLDQYFELVMLSANKLSLSSEARSVLRKFELFAQSDSESFLECLVNYRMLVFPLLSSDSNGDILSVPKMYLNMWYPIFRGLISCHLVQKFVCKLSENLTEAGSERDRSFLSWIFLICEGTQLDGSSSQSKLKTVGPRSFDKKKILELVMRNPNKFSTAFIKKFCFHFTELRHAVQKNLLDLLSFYESSSNTSNNGFIDQHLQSCQSSSDEKIPPKRKRALEIEEKKFNRIEIEDLPFGVLSSGSSFTDLLLKPNSNRHNSSAKTTSSNGGDVPMPKRRKLSASLENCT